MNPRSLLSSYIHLFAVIASFIHAAPAQSSSIPSLSASQFLRDKSPFNSINAIGLANNWLFCVGTTDSNRNDKVHSVQTNVSSSDRSWVLAWQGSSTSENRINYNGIGVKHSPLQIKQNIMILPDSNTLQLEIHSFWYLNPLQSPDKDTPMRTTPFPTFSNVISSRNATTNVTVTSTNLLPDKLRVISSLDSNGGVYASGNSSLYWIPIVAPFSSNPPRLKNASVTNEPIPQGINRFDPTGPINAAGLGTRTTPIKLRNVTGQITAMWLPQRFDKLYTVEQFNETNYIWAWDISEITSESIPLNDTMLSESQGTLLFSLNQTNFPYNISSKPIVSSIAVSPSSGDIYLGLAKMVLVFANQKLRQRIDTGLDVNSLEIDNSGSNLYIAGNAGGIGSIDVVDLTNTGLSVVSYAGKSFDIKLFGHFGFILFIIHWLVGADWY